MLVHIFLFGVFVLWDIVCFLQFTPLLPHPWFWPLLPLLNQNFGRFFCLLRPSLGLVLSPCHLIHLFTPLLPNILVWELLWSHFSYWNWLRMPMPFEHPSINNPLLLAPVSFIPSLYLLMVYLPPVMGASSIIIIIINITPLTWTLQLLRGRWLPGGILTILLQPKVSVKAYYNIKASHCIPGQVSHMMTDYRWNIFFLNHSITLAETSLWH